MLTNTCNLGNDTTIMDRKALCTRVWRNGTGFQRWMHWMVILKLLSIHLVTCQVCL